MRHPDSLPLLPLLHHLPSTDEMAMKDAITNLIEILAIFLFLGLIGFAILSATDTNSQNSQPCGHPMADGPTQYCYD